MSGAAAERGEKADTLVAQTPQRDLEHGGRGRVEPLEVVEGDDHGLLGRRALRSTSSTASPIAPCSGGCSPGSASQSAISSARRRGGASDPPGYRTRGRADRRARRRRARPRPRSPRWTRTRPKRRSASSTPTSQSIVFPIPASPERTSAHGPRPTASRNLSTAPSSWSRPMTAVVIGPPPSPGCPRARRGGRRACGRRARGAPRRCSRP